jgi:hypothetical protein
MVFDLSDFHPDLLHNLTLYRLLAGLARLYKACKTAVEAPVRTHSRGK